MAHGRCNRLSSGPLNSTISRELVHNKKSIQVSSSRLFPFISFVCHLFLSHWHLACVIVTFVFFVSIRYYFFWRAFVLARQVSCGVCLYMIVKLRWWSLVRHPFPSGIYSSDDRTPQSCFTIGVFWFFCAPIPSRNTTIFWVCRYYRFICRLMAGGRQVWRRLSREKILCFPALSLTPPFDAL